jgi:hypothetical protein
LPVIIPSFPAVVKQYNFSGFLASSNGKIVENNKFISGKIVPSKMFLGLDYYALWAL